MSIYVDQRCFQQSSCRCRPHAKHRSGRLSRAALLEQRHPRQCGRRLHFDRCRLGRTSPPPMSRASTVWGTVRARHPPSRGRG